MGLRAPILINEVLYAVMLDVGHNAHVECKGVEPPPSSLLASHDKYAVVAAIYLPRKAKIMTKEKTCQHPSAGIVLSLHTPT